MKKSILILFLLQIILTAGFSQRHVRGYYKKNGTYVSPYYRSSPDKSLSNNYSYPGNYNPYTGKEATGSEESYYNHAKRRHRRRY